MFFGAAICHWPVWQIACGPAYAISFESNLHSARFLTAWCVFPCIREDVIEELLQQEILDENDRMRRQAHLKVRHPRLCLIHMFTNDKMAFDYTGLVTIEPELNLPCVVLWSGFDPAQGFGWHEEGRRAHHGTRRHGPAHRHAGQSGQERGGA